MTHFLLRTLVIVSLGGLAVFSEHSPETVALHAPLRWLVAAGAASCAGIFGLPTYLDGTTIHSINYSVAVIPACGGFSGMVLVFATAALLSLEWRLRIKFALLGVGVVYTFNVVRVSSVLMVGTRSSKGADFLHELLFPAIGTIAFAALWFYWLRREAPSGLSKQPVVQQ